ncbi:ATP-binding protein [Chamaesiphon minutus]|uniref:Anti-sigma regulatory factor (Ser/Thr protein kinase) n=1 Tax=Chamaesiphon minutus (strain ATCC 27169 / PCC 6605) TaxID=1173020 RepID=K9UHK4_CHAP6|nr:anti-sigma regulatory factor [Chamaesiphon minutus]AFY94597.1 anti-sigma regulatory factor (Ser/Thr protein kinase) [Chamaesiphon minutus PCC 6605]
MVLSPIKSEWDKVSFSSTLFLCPILDSLLSAVPSKWQTEIRLGLQEALVNAAKHGNNLDPHKQVIVRFCFEEGAYWWIISDEGSGFHPPARDLASSNEKNRPDSFAQLPPMESESGRGMFLLHQIFDRVVWNRQGTELSLCKQLYCQLAGVGDSLPSGTTAPKEKREPLLT